MEQSTDEPNEQDEHEDVDSRERTPRPHSQSQDEILEKLKRAQADEDVDAIRDNLDYITDNYPELETTAEVEDARKLLKTLLELKEKVALEKLRQATIKQNENEIRKRLFQIEENFPELSETTEIEDAKKLLQRLQEDREAAAVLNRLYMSVKMRDEKNIKQELDNISTNYPELSKNKDVREANKLLKKIQAEKVAMKQKMILERLHQAKIRQDEDQIREILQYIEKSLPELQKRLEVLEANEWLRILETADELKEVCKSRNKDAIAEILVRTENDKSLREALRFLILDARNILEELNKSKRSPPLKYDLSSFNEMRRYFVPPPGVLQVMQAVFLILGVDEDKTRMWHDIQRLWKPNGKDSLYKQIVNFNDEDVHPMIAARAREILLGQYEEVTLTEDDRHRTRDRGYEIYDGEVEEYGAAEDKRDKLRDEKSTARELYGEDEDEENFDGAENTKAADSPRLTGVITKKKGIDIKQLQQSCPVARTLLVWVLNVVQNVEDREGSEAMVPARDVREQRKILGSVIPKLPKLDRGYYRDLAQKSLRRGPQQLPPPQRKSYRANSDERSYRYYQQINQELPRLVNPVDQFTYTSSAWSETGPRRRLPRRGLYRDGYYDGQRHGYSSRNYYYDDGERDAY